ncbi:MAG: hypothetical protein QM719_05095 [Thermomonas sp.]
MILDILFEFLSSTLSLPERVGATLVSILMFVCGTAFLAIAVLLAVNVPSIQAAAVLLCIFLLLSLVSYWFMYRAIIELRRTKGQA